MEAMNRGSPFPPIPEALKELAGKPMTIKFRVSTKPRESPSQIYFLGPNLELQTDH